MAVARRRFFAFFLGFIAFSLAGVAAVAAEVPASQACQIPLPRLSVKRANIFTPQQEGWLGEAQSARIEPDYMLLPTDKTGYLDGLAEKIAAELPPAPYHYRGARV